MPIPEIFSSFIPAIGISHVTLFNYLKKAKSLASFKTTILPTENNQATLEVDEILSLCFAKSQSNTHLDSPKTKKTDKLYLFLLAMVRWILAKNYGENCPMNFSNLTVLAIFGSLIISFPKIPTQKLEKKLGLPIMLNA